jgi:hypothetical protein
MKVFLSWSGAQSQAIAKQLSDWLPTVLQSAKPFMSAENVEKGERWSLDIAVELQDTQFGIICLTQDNIAAPWILFEAGALSKSIERSRVSPLLFNLSPSDLASSPLLQFQSTTFEKFDVLKLLSSVNLAAPEPERIAKEVLTRAFERAWSELETSISTIIQAADDDPKSKKSGKPKLSQAAQVELMEELLLNTRAILNAISRQESVGERRLAEVATLVAEKERLLQALASKEIQALALKETGALASDSHPVWRDFASVLSELGSSAGYNALPPEKIAEHIGTLRHIYDYLLEQLTERPPSNTTERVSLRRRELWRPNS